MNRLKMVFSSILVGWSVTMAHAQSAFPIYSFDGSGTNGSAPEANLTLGSDGSFYGTTEGGGTNSDGTIFKVTANGTLTTLVDFNGTNGASPLAALTLGPDGNFYGTTEYGGNTNFDAGLGGGTVFRMTTNGTLTTLVNFAATNGTSPHAGLTWAPDGNFYGTTASGGPDGLTYGTVFRMTIGGTLTSLTNFNNANGDDPTAGLTFGPDGNLYGTTQSGGTAGTGTIFQLTTNGILTPLFSFGTNNGASVQAGLTLGTDGNLYGTTSASGVFPYTVFPGFTINLPTGNGTVFRITTNGVLTTLVDFDNYPGAGVTPNAYLTLGPDGNFYSSTYTGGTSNLGTIFEVTTNGTLTTLANFNNTNGAYPLASVTLGFDGNFYGTSTGGGSGGNGTIFKLGLPPSFIVNPASESVIIGNPAEFGSQVFGTAAFDYQWLSNSVPVAGATGSSLLLPHVFAPANGAQFQVVVTNSYGSATSQVASLTVVFQPNSYAIASSGGGSYTIFAASYPNSMNTLWATTNLALPSSWQDLGPLTTDPSGRGQFLDINSANSPAKFYQLSYP
jgi:uncharacterized repeat protein (TIGR03803 family)